MKRILPFILIALLALSMLSRCSGAFGGSTASPEQTENPATSSAASDKSPNVNTQTPTTSAPSADASIVYITTDISSEGLMAIYEPLRFEATGEVAIKLSTGEPPNSNYLRPELIRELVHSLDGTILHREWVYLWYYFTVQYSAIKKYTNYLVRFKRKS